MRVQSLGDTKALADVYTVSAEPRFKINSFSLPFGSQGVEVHGSSWSWGQHLPQARNHASIRRPFISGILEKKTHRMTSLSGDAPLAHSDPTPGFPPVPTLSCWAVNGQSRPNKEFIQRVPGGREVLFPVETRENYPTTRAPDHKCL